MESRVVKVVIGTTNPAKRAAVAAVLDKLFPSGGSQLLAVSVPSGVSAQPFDVHETVRSSILFFPCFVLKLRSFSKQIHK
jgi:non-canonical (house-cleaning) NTP pyrophosphatase